MKISFWKKSTKRQITSSQMQSLIFYQLIQTEQNQIALLLMLKIKSFRRLFQRQSQSFLCWQTCSRDSDRFSDDYQELMGQLGVSYTSGFLHQPLREQSTKAQRQRLLDQYYIPHRQKLLEAVEESLSVNNYYLIIDGHDFPGLPIPHELQKSAFQPDCG